MPTLIVIGPKLAVREYELTGTLSVGRHESNAIQLTEEKASRMHCTVRIVSGQTSIEDLNSANGVFVNGLRVSSQILKNNDRVTIGQTTIVFSDKKVSERLSDTKVLIARISSELSAVVPDEADSHAPTLNLRGGVAKVDPSKAEIAVDKLTRIISKSATHKKIIQHVTMLVLGLVILGVAWNLFKQSQASQPIADDVPVVKAPVKRRPAVLVAEPVPQKSEPDIKVVETPVAVTEAPHIPLDQQLQATLAARDRALGTGNLLGAKAALLSFLAAVPAGQSDDESVRRARRELDETSKVANAALGMSLDQAREAFTGRHFHLVSQRCTSLISNDPNGPFGKKAREMLEQIDEQTAQTAATAKGKALEAVSRGQLGQARAAVESVMGELTGTRWAGDIDTLQYQLIVATSFLEKAEAARAVRASSGARIPVNYAAKKINGTLLSINGLQARVRVGQEQIEMPVNLKNLETSELNSIFNGLGLSDEHTELACFWSVVGRQDAARCASESALKKPGDTPLAATVAGMLGQSKNIHLYDFKGWRQQLDWEALSGSWLSQDGKYVLETPDGGETSLKPASIGGAFPLDAARVSFEFEIRKPTPGWIFSVELGNERQAVVLAFSEIDVTLQDKTGVKSAPVKWTPASTRIDIAIKGDTVAFTIDGAPAAKLEIPGIAKEKGTIAFQARQCGCAIDNVILRSQE